MNRPCDLFVRRHRGVVIDPRVPIHLYVDPSRRHEHVGTLRGDWMVNDFDYTPVRNLNVVSREWIDTRTSHTLVLAGRTAITKSNSAGAPYVNLGYTE